MSDEPDIEIVRDLPALDVYLEDPELKGGKHKVKFPDKYPNMNMYRNQSFKTLCLHYFSQTGEVHDVNLVSILDFMHSYAMERNIHLTLENIFDIDTSTLNTEEKVWLQNIRTNYKDITEIVLEFKGGGKLYPLFQFLEERIPDEKTYNYLEVRIEIILKKYWEQFNQENPSYVPNQVVPLDIQSIIISTIRYMRSIPQKDIENMMTVYKPIFVLYNHVLDWFISMFLFHNKFHKQPIREISKETAEKMDIIFSQLKDQT